MSYKYILCSLSNRPEVSDLSWESIQGYCDLHGYTFHKKTTVYTEDRHPSWSKILFLQDLVLQNVATETIVIWIDDDMIITNLEIQLCNLLSNFESSSMNIAVQEDTHGELFNCGFIAVKCNDMSYKCLQEIWDACNSYEKKQGYWEQTTMQRVYRSTDNILKPQLFLFPPRTLQSFYKPNESYEFQWSPGDFIAHVSGLHTPMRIHYMTLLRNYMNKRLSDNDIHRIIVQ